ncbi:MAG: hypothetical protein ONA90_00330, partial [candidate division KSB1 bacterium]|nr:hypothetical protein [candidate division KSB1 bacterium]
FILATQLEWHWKFAPRWQFAGMLAQALNGLPHDYWFWHQPEGYGKLYFETSQSFFEGDLEILPRLVGRFIGKRYSPVLATGNIALLENELPATAVLDFQIRLGYGDGALLFSWENVFNRPFDWRSGVPAIGRFLRWGFWWNFWN